MIQYTGSGETQGMVSKGMDSIWQLFIEPKRNLFPKDRLGHLRFRVEPDYIFEREDGYVSNVHGETVEFTLYNLQKNYYPFGMDEQETCVIYLHSHGSNRIEGLGLLGPCGDIGASLCVFDFGGSGYSGGKYTTLGVKEAGECKVVLQHLKDVFGFKKFILWGRSMGAVTAIIFASECPQDLDFLVLDSPFSDMEELVKDLGDGYITMGGWFTNFFFQVIRDDIRKRIGFDLADLKPIYFVPNISTPCAFIVADGDSMTFPKRIEEMYQKCGARRKHFLMINGTHSSARSHEEIIRIINLIRFSRDCGPVGDSFILEQNYMREQANNIDKYTADADEDVSIYKMPSMGNVKRLKTLISKNEPEVTRIHNQGADSDHTYRDSESEYRKNESHMSEKIQIASCLSVVGNIRTSKVNENDNNHGSQKVEGLQLKNINHHLQVNTHSNLENKELEEGVLRLRESIIGNLHNEPMIHLWDSLVLDTDRDHRRSNENKGESISRPLDTSYIQRRDPSNIPEEEPISPNKMPRMKLTSQRSLNASIKKVNIFEESTPIMLDKLRVIK